MSAPVHMAHETGAWNLAVAAAFLAVAAAPRLAAGALPFLGTFAALLVPVTLADLGAGSRARRPRGRAPAARSPGVVLVAVVAWRSRRRRAVAVGRRGCPREARRASWSRLLARLAARRRRDGRARRRRTRRWSPPTRARAPGWTASPAEVTLEFSEGVSLGAGLRAGR